MVGHPSSVGAGGDIHGHGSPQAGGVAVCYAIHHGRWSFHLDVR